MKLVQDHANDARRLEWYECSESKNMKAAFLLLPGLCIHELDTGAARMKLK